MVLVLYIIPHVLIHNIYSIISMLDSGWGEHQGDCEGLVKVASRYR